MEILVAEEVRRTVRDNGYVHGNDFMTRKGKFSILVESVIVIDELSINHMSEFSTDYSDSLSIKFLLERAKYERKIKSLEEKDREIEVLHCYLKPLTLF